MSNTDFTELERQEEERNLTWQTNHVKIIEASNYLIDRNDRLPTQIEIAERSGLSRRTVNKHLQELKICQELRVNLVKVELMGDNIYATLIKEAQAGNMTAVRLWLLITGALGNKKAGD